MREEIIKMAREAGCIPRRHPEYWDDVQVFATPDVLERFFHMAQAAEREALEIELLKLKDGIAANSIYIQGRWDLIGEFQDIIRARGQA